MVAWPYAAACQQNVNRNQKSYVVWLSTKLRIFSQSKSYSQIAHGRSIAQKVLRIGLERHRTLSATQIIIRNFVAFGLVTIPGLNLLNVLVIVFSKTGKGLHDQLVGTRIVKLLQNS